MAIRVLNRFPGANVRVLAQRPDPDPEVLFTPDPHNGPEALWFHFHMEDTDPPVSRPESLTLTMRFFGNQPGRQDPALYRPVIRERGKGWNRLRAPVVTHLEDLQPLLHWTIPYPATRMEIALSHPYGREELDVMLQRTKGYWREETIGLTQGGRLLTRLDNRISGKASRGLYLLARQHPGDAPGSWVLDGMLETISRNRAANWCVSAIPFADLDGVIDGNHGSTATGGNQTGTWGQTPGRHETAVMQSDMARWAAHCRPELVVDLRASDMGVQDGIDIATAPATPEIERQAQAWINIMQHGLGPEFATENVARAPGQPLPTPTTPISAYVHEMFECPALAVHTPFTSARDILMSPKQYREAGRRLTQAILSRWQQNQRS